MDKFKFSVTSDIFDEFPEAKFGGILVRELTKNPDTRELLKNFQKNVLEDLNSTEVQYDSKIIAWNNFFIKNIGKDKKAAHIALIDRVIKQGQFPQVNELVDIYNTFSVHKRIPIGGHDISNRNEIIVGKTTGGESFQIMNSTENEVVDNNEYAYLDDQHRILTRNLVWRQSDYSKITDNTTEFFVPFDDLFNLFTNTQISDLMTEFLGILSKFYNFKYEISIIDKYHREHHFNNFSTPGFDTPRILLQRQNVISDESRINNFIDHKIDQIYPSSDELRKRLESGERLKFYIGADATGPNLHLGHLIPILKLRELQQMGHEIIFLVGDFTARLGDPTDKSETRKLLSKEEVEENSKEYQKQIAKYIDFEGSDNPARIVFNSTWNEKLSLSDVIKLASHTTVQQMLERDMFEERIKSNKPIFLHEFLYPLIQGYDSVELEVDGEFGGRDQTFNMLMGRTLMKAYKNKDKFVLTTHFLLSADGVNKMSKSIGNCIFINDSAETKYAKVMSIPDDLIIHYYKLATNKTLEEIEVIENRLKTENDPMKIKKELAYEITEIHEGEELAKRAEQFFTNTVQNNLAPETTDTFSVSNFSSDTPTLKEIITSTNSVESNAEAKRLIRANAVEINGDVETDINKQFERKNLQFLRVGKKFWIKFID